MIRALFRRNRRVIPPGNLSLAAEEFGKDLENLLLRIRRIWRIRVD